jgi:prepilin-type N-terminal cleavage/methylation domain-containing protein
MPADRSRSSILDRRHHAGFSLLELSIVLSIIVVLLAAVSSGADVYRQAEAMRIQNDFVSAWTRVWNSYMSSTGNIPPGDNASDPSYLILQAKNEPLCNGKKTKNLSNAILSKLGDKITLPSGSALDSPDLYVYQDKNGVPHQLKVCLMTVDWSVQSTSVDKYVLQNKHVMRIDGLSPELAIKLDVMNDGRIDARHGIFRQLSLAASSNPASREWGKDANYDSSQFVEVRAYLLLGH